MLISHQKLQSRTESPLIIAIQAALRTGEEHKVNFQVLMPKAIVMHNSIKDKQWHQEKCQGKLQRYLLLIVWLFLLYLTSQMKSTRHFFLLAY